MGHWEVHAEGWVEALEDQEETLVVRRPPLQAKSLPYGQVVVWVCCISSGTMLRSPRRCSPPHGVLSPLHRPLCPSPYRIRTSHQGDDSRLPGPTPRPAATRRRPTAASLRTSARRGRRARRCRTPSTAAPLGCAACETRPMLHSDWR